MRDSLRRLASEEPERSRAGMRRARIELLDGDHINVDVDRKANGGDLLDKVCESLELQDKDFFGLLHQFRGDPRVWVDLNKRLSKTFRNEPWDMRLAVKFYPPEPSELADDNTRYQLSLAVRRDLMEGRLTCSSITSALLASYVLQAELGDYSGCLPPSALTELRAAPICSMGDDFEGRVEELYRKHRGQTPAEAELNYLENAKKLCMYGVELHCATDCGGAAIQLAVGAAGVSVFRDGVIMNRFPWAKISKLSYNKRAFGMKLRPAEFDECETQILFRLASSRSCRSLWRCAVEHHMFFRREEPVAVCRVSLPGLRLGARRLSCRRTLRQMRAAPPAVAVH